MDENNNQGMLTSEEERKRRKELALKKVAAKKNKKKKTAIIGSICTGLVLVFALVYFFVLVPKQHLDQGILLRESGNWDEALAAFEKAGNYGDAKEQIKETKYQRAKACYSEGKIEEAYTIYKSIRDYKDVDAILNEDQEIAKVREKIKSAIAKGDIVIFGTFEQDNNTGNGTEPIEWLVLSTNEGKALLTSKYLLSAISGGGVTLNVYSYSDTPVRRWLNNTFYNSAFNGFEQKAIVETKVSNGSSQSNTYKVTTGSSKYTRKTETHHHGAGEDTNDKIFVLSYSEAWRYLSDEERKCQPTAYALTQNFEADYNGAAEWWLRSAGDAEHHLAFVTSYGSDASTYGYPGTKGVRPTMWVDLDVAVDWFK